jgi:predicted CXXCH cytochrome family protein
VQDDRYSTKWREFGISCERCHGPGKDHIARASAAPPDAQTRALVKSTIVNPARLDASRSSMICAQCHSLRDTYAQGFVAGANYYDYFVPLMEDRLPSSPDPAYWADGRPRWLANEAVAFWQSQCFLKGGATCTTCHSRPHNDDVNGNPKLRPTNNVLCAGCHKTIAADPGKHTHHPPNSLGNSCIECHMPATVASLNTRMRDHSLSVPVPENTIRHDIPNACNVCHRDKNAEWANRYVNTWYGNKGRQSLIVRADAFSLARQGDAAAVPGLLQILSDASESDFIRANAADYLGAFPDDPNAYDALVHAISDQQPLVRATAALAVRPRAAQRAALAPALVAMLADPVQTVRLNAGIALVSMGVKELPGEDGQRLLRAEDLYRGRAELNSDDAQQQLAAGKFFLLAGDMDSAISHFRATLKLDQNAPARYFLGVALAQKGDSQSARDILQSIAANDPQYEPAQRVLAELATSAPPSDTTSQQANTGAATSPQADAAFREGQRLYQNNDYGGALNQLEQALQLAPKASWATTAETERVISLEKLGRDDEAENALKSLSGSAGTNIDLQLAYVELLYDTGRQQEALQRVDQLMAAVPKLPMAYFWRAKVLLQLQRTDDAAKAAEEAVRLQPDLPAVHNVLIRIYQKQGRTQEAAQQAQWVSEYQRRMQSR